VQVLAQVRECLRFRLISQSAKAAASRSTRRMGDNKMNASKDTVLGGTFEPIIAPA